MGSGYREVLIPVELPDAVCPTLRVDKEDPGHLRGTRLGEQVRVFPARQFDTHPCNVVPWPVPAGADPLCEGTGVAPVACGDFKVWHVPATGRVMGRNAAVGSGEYTVAAHDRRRGQLFTRELNYHPCGDQVFAPKEARGGATHYGLMLGASCCAHALTAHDVSFVVAPVNTGVAISAGVWHNPPVPLVEDEDGLLSPGGTVLFNNKQSSVHACVERDFGTEEPLRVHLRDLPQEEGGSDSDSDLDPDEEDDTAMFRLEAEGFFDDIHS